MPNLLPFHAAAQSGLYNSPFAPSHPRVRPYLFLLRGKDGLAVTIATQLFNNPPIKKPILSILCATL